MVPISGYPFDNGSAKALPLFRQKTLFFDDAAASCLKPCGLSGGNTHRETARFRAIRSCVHAAGAGMDGLRTVALNNPKGFLNGLTQQRFGIAVVLRQGVYVIIYFAGAVMGS